MTKQITCSCGHVLGRVEVTGQPASPRFPPRRWLSLQIIDSCGVQTTVIAGEGLPLKTKHRRAVISGGAT